MRRYASPPSSPSESGPARPPAWSRGALALLFAALLLSAPTASAQGDADGIETLDPGPNLEAEARALFEAAIVAYQAERFDNAVDYFQRAYTLSQRPALLFNIGLAADRARRDELAIASFRAYLDALPEAPNANQVRRRLATLERARNRWQAESGGDGGGDGAEADGSGGATDGGGGGSEGAVATRGDDDTDGDAGEPREDAPRVDGASHGGPNLGLVIGGAVALAGAGGAAFYWHDRAGARTDCGAGGSACLNAADLDRQKNIGLGLTIGLAAVGATLLTLGFVLRHDDGDGDGEATLRCGSAGLGVSCRARF